MKMNKIIIASLSALLTLSPQLVSAQKLFNQIERGIRAIDNAANNKNRNLNELSEKSKNSNVQNYKVTEGKILFGTGSSTTSTSGIQPVSSINLTSPSFYQVQLSEPAHDIKKKIDNLGQYGVISNYVNINYYINNELITSYSDEIEPNTFQTGTVYAFPIVPSNNGDFKNNEMSVGVLAHVFSSLNPGTYKLRLEYTLTQNIKKENVTDYSQGEYDHKEIIIASGEVNVQVDASSVNAYAKNYGRPKFTKGVLQGQATLENQIVEIIQREYNKTPIYVYASDSWTILRGNFDVITGREARVYYVYKADNGRCEMADIMIRQNYEGNNYGHPILRLNKYAPAFKYVVCQNY